MTQAEHDKECQAGYESVMEYRKQHSAEQTLRECAPSLANTLFVSSGFIEGIRKALREIRD